MANTRDIRLRIKAVQNIQKITRAMQMIAASRLKRAQDAALATGPYAEKMALMMRELSGARSQVKHPLLAERPVERRLVIGIAAEKGLCGAYNTNVLRLLRKEMSGGPSDVVSVGKKAADYLRFRKIASVAHYAMPAGGADMTLVQELTRQVVQRYSSGECDQVTLVYTQFRSVVTTVPTAVQLLPLEAPEAEDGPDEVATRAVPFIFEPAAEELFPLLLEKYIQNQLYRALVDAFASELGARMVAMKNATDNADELVTSLKLKFNKMRQTAITSELLEVMSGAEALAD